MVLSNVPKSSRTSLIVNRTAASGGSVGGNKKQGLFPTIGVRNSQISYKYNGPCCNPEPNILE